VWNKIAMTENSFINLDQVDFRVLERLEQFSFYSEDEVDVITGPLIKHGQPNKSLRELTIGCPMTRLGFRQWLTDMTPEFTAKFRMLNQLVFDHYLYWFVAQPAKLQVRQLWSVAERFEHLTTLW